MFYLLKRYCIWDKLSESDEYGWRCGYEERSEKAQSKTGVLLVVMSEIKEEPDQLAPMCSRDDSMGGQ